MDTGQMNLTLALNLQLGFLIDLDLINGIYTITITARKKEKSKSNNNNRKERRRSKKCSPNNLCF